MKSRSGLCFVHTACMNARPPNFVSPRKTARGMMFQLGARVGPVSQSTPHAENTMGCFFGNLSGRKSGTSFLQGFEK